MIEMNSEEHRIWRFKRDYTDLLNGLNDPKGVWKMKPPTPLHVVSISVNHFREQFDDIWYPFKNVREGEQAKLARFRKAVRKSLLEKGFDPEGVDYQYSEDTTILLGFTDLSQATLAKMALSDL